jgi:hypothetical protein
MSVIYVIYAEKLYLSPSGFRYRLSDISGAFSEAGLTSKLRVFSMAIVVLFAVLIVLSAVSAVLSVGCAVIPVVFRGSLRFVAVRTPRNREEPQRTATNLQKPQ